MSTFLTNVSNKTLGAMCARAGSPGNVASTTESQFTRSASQIRAHALHQLTARLVEGFERGRDA